MRRRRRRRALAVAAHSRPAQAAGWTLAAILGLAAAAAYGVALWRAPGWMHATTAQAAYNARVLVISVGGAFVVGAGLLYTARNYRLSRRGHFRERFTIALERLGSSELYVRIGGVHALEHVMRDSAEHHNDVIEVVNAFIRDRTPRRGRQVWHPVTGSVLDPDLPPEPALDIQAALTTLAHRPHRPERQWINLTGKHLAGANLTGADLYRAVLTGAGLSGAALYGAALTGADLSGADLSGADLSGAALNHADLTGAALYRTDWDPALYNANLARVARGLPMLAVPIRGHANLAGADLSGAVWPPDAPVPVGWQRGDTGRLARAEPSPGGEANW